MKVTAKSFAQLAAGVFFVLAALSVLVAFMGGVRPVFLGDLDRNWTLLAALAFGSAGAVLLSRREEGWFWGLLVSAAFTAVGLVQLAGRDRIGVATTVIGVAVFASIWESSDWFPRVHGTYVETLHRDGVHHDRDDRDEREPRRPLFGRRADAV